jgi:uncharacterized membrane protein
MRSLMAPAVIAWTARRSGFDLESTPFSAFKGPGIGRTAAAVALGELVADRSPYDPKLSPSSVLLGRAVAGGAAGAAVYKARHGNMILGALVGAAAAVGVAYAGHFVRKQVARKYQVSDRAMALAEDGLALAAGLVAISLVNRENRTEEITEATRSAA